MTLQTQDKTLVCKRCQSEAFVKNGFVRGYQRYRCKACGYNFTDIPPQGRPLVCKVFALTLYLSGLSHGAGVSTPSVQDWVCGGIRRASGAGRAVVEVDELCHCPNKRCTLWVWAARDCATWCPPVLHAPGTACAGSGFLSQSTRTRGETS